VERITLPYLTYIELEEDTSIVLGVLVFGRKYFKNIIQRFVNLP